MQRLSALKRPFLAAGGVALLALLAAFALPPAAAQTETTAPALGSLTCSSDSPFHIKATFARPAGEFDIYVAELLDADDDVVDRKVKQPTGDDGADQRIDFYSLFGYQEGEDGTELVHLYVEEQGDGEIVQANTSYTIQVRTVIGEFDDYAQDVSSTTNSDWAQCSGTTQAETTNDDDEARAPDAPVISEIIAGPRSLTLGWYAPNGYGSLITGYRILWRVQGDATFEHQSPSFHGFIGPWQWQSITGLIPDRTYEVQLLAANLHGWTEKSEWVTATTSTPRPARPARPTISDLTASGFTVAWSAVADPAATQPITDYDVRYEVRRGGISSNPDMPPWVELADTSDSTALSATVSGLNLRHGDWVHVQVRAQNANGEGIWSSSRLSRYPAIPPPISGFSLRDGSGSKIQPLNNGDAFSADLGVVEIRADLRPELWAVGRVDLELTGPVSATKSEGIPPYELYGGAGAQLPAGQYTLTATAYPGLAGGRPMQTATVSFTVEPVIQQQVQQVQAPAPEHETQRSQIPGPPDAPAAPTFSELTSNGFQAHWSSADSTVTKYEYRATLVAWGFALGSPETTNTHAYIDVVNRSSTAAIMVDVEVRAYNGSWSDWSAKTRVAVPPVVTSPEPAEEPEAAPEPEPASTPASPVVGFTLLNSNNKSVIQSLTDGATVASGPGKLEIRADLRTGERVGSIRMELRGPINSTRTENWAPYELYGGHRGQGRVVPSGTYTLTARPFTKAHLGGQELTSLSITFTVE